MKHPDAYRIQILRELLDCVDSLVLVADRDLRVIEANRAAAMILGYTAGELSAMRLPSLAAKPERERVARLCKSAKERHGGKIVLTTKTGESRPGIFSVSPIRDGGGRTKYSLIIVRLAEDSSSDPADDPTNGLADRMLKGFADPVFIIDGPSRTVRDCNGAAVAAFGFSRSELLGRRLLDRISHPEPAQRGRSIESKADRHYATAGIFQDRVLFPRRDGAPLPCDLVGLPFFGRDGSLALIIAMLFDRSSQEAREAELSEVVDRVRGLSAELASLVAQSSSRARSKRLSDLGFTSRQVEIARLCASGSSSKEIGYELGISESTVKNHLALMYRKMGVHSRIAFARAIAAKRFRIE